MDSILSARSESRVIGFRQVKRAIDCNQLRCAVVAGDIDEVLKAQIIALCKEKEVPYTVVESKSTVGKQLGIDVACAVCGLLRQ